MLQFIRTPRFSGRNSISASGVSDNQGTATVELCVIKCAEIQIRSGDIPAEQLGNNVIKCAEYVLLKAETL